MSAIPGPDNVTRVRFDNGLTVLVRENHAAPVAVLQGSLPAGVVYEPSALAGLTAFTASMLSRGSANYAFAAFNEAVEAVGGNLTFAADTHSTDAAITCLSEDLPLLIDIMADALRRPQFPVEHVERVRRQRLVRLQERDEDTGAVASLRFYEDLFGREHPYGRANDGYPETVHAIHRSDLVDFQAHRYTPQGAVFVVAGDVETQAVLDLLHRKLGDWQAGPPAAVTLPPVARHGRTRLMTGMEGKVQADIILGAPAIARPDPDFYAVRVANCILGQFGLMGRLGAKVREEQGLAYYAYSGVMAEQQGGAWLAAAGVNPEHVEAAIESIEAEIVLLGEEGPTAEELADSKAYLTGIMPLTLETNDGVAGTLLSIEWYDLGLDYLHRYPDLINAVTLEDVQRVVRTYLRPENFTIAVAGPEETAD